MVGAQLRRAAWAALLLGILLPPGLMASGFRYRFEIRDRLFKQVLRESALNPGNLLQVDTSLENRLELNGEMRLALGESVILSAADILRLHLEEGETARVTNVLREALVTLRVSPLLFIDVGKKLLRCGSGFFKQPLDFIIYQGETDLSRSREEQDRLLEGRYGVRVEYFLGSLTTSLFYVPAWRLVEQGAHQVLLSTQYKWGQQDAELVVHYDGHWNAGIGYSAVVGQALTLHLEAAWRSEQVRYGFQESYGYLSAVAEKKQGLQLLAGAHYTFAGGAGLWLEYYFRQVGWSGSEWESFLSHIEQNKANSTAQQQANLYALNEAVSGTGFTDLQRHYAMLRFAHRNLWPGFDFSVVAVTEFLHPGLMVLAAPVLRPWEGVAFKATASLFPGVDNSEFGLLYTGQQYTFEATAYF